MQTSSVQFDKSGEVRPHQLFNFGVWFLSTLSFSVLLILAIIFYEERIYQDASYYLMYVINDHSFHIEHDRWVLILSQLLPLAGVLLHLPLKAILILQSISSVVFALGVFSILAFWMKDLAGALAVLTLQFIGIMQGFFTPMFEMYYGIALSVVLFSLLKNERSNKWNWLLMILLEVVVLFSHPMTFIIVAFFSMFLLLEQKRKFLKKFFLVWGIIILVYIIKQLTFSEYEAGKINDFSTAIHQGTYREFIKGYWLRAMFCFLCQQYSACTLMFVILTILWISRRKFLNVVLLSISVYATICLVNFNIFGFGISRYREIEFYAMVPLFVVPFVYEIGRVKIRWLKISLHLFLFGAITFQSVLIVKEWQQFFHPRVEMIKRLIKEGEEMNKHQLAVAPQNVTFIFPPNDWRNDRRSLLACFSAPKNNFGYDADDWSLPIESMLLSAQSGKGQTITIIRTSDLADTNYRSANSGNYRFRLDETKPTLWLNKNYFTLESSGYYRMNQMNSLVDSLDAFAKNISLLLDSNNILSQGKHLFVPITISNGNAIPLASQSQNQISISYHFMRSHQLYQWNGIRTPIETDVRNDYQQNMKVELPDEPGSYELVADVVAEDTMWFHAPCNTILMHVK